MGFQWITSPEKAFVAGYDRWAQSRHQAIYQLALLRAPQIEAWMKINAPWRDGTANARQSLNAKVFQEVHQVIIQLAHGVDYGVYLELSKGGKFGIILPALDHWVPILAADLRRLLS